MLPDPYPEYHRPVHTDFFIDLLYLYAPHLSREQCNEILTLVQAQYLALERIDELDTQQHIKPSSAKTEAPDTSQD